jgi:hypothetical protein
MKVSYNLRNCTVEADGKDAKDVFSQIAAAVEVFSQNQCQACSSTDVVPCVREVQGNTYYEMRCTNCHATLGFGQRKADGALYPRRKDADGNFVDNYGWKKWERKQAADVAADDFVSF